MGTAFAQQSTMGPCIYTRTEGGILVLYVAGPLQGEGLEEFRKACISDPHPAVVDLADLLSVSEEALAILHSLADGGTVLRSVPPYASIRLRARFDEAPVPPTPVPGETRTEP